MPERHNGFCPRIVCVCLPGRSFTQRLVCGKIFRCIRLVQKNTQHFIQGSRLSVNSIKGSGFKGSGFKVRGFGVRSSEFRVQGIESSNLQKFMVEVREAEALEWAEATFGDVNNEAG